MTNFQDKANFIWTKPKDYRGGRFVKDKLYHGIQNFNLSIFDISVSMFIERHKKRS